MAVLIMNHTLFGKKLLIIATITVLATSLTLAATFDDAQASGTRTLKCKTNGTFFTPIGPPSLDGDPTAVSVFSAAVGKCSNNSLTKVAAAGVLKAGVVADGSGCVAISTPGEPNVVFNKKFKSLDYTITGSQCFKDSTGSALPAGPVVAFCGASTDAFTSIVTGTFTITDGTGKFAGATGGGTITSTVDHCDPSAPFGNSFKSKFIGTLTIP